MFAALDIEPGAEPQEGGITLKFLRFFRAHAAVAAERWEEQPRQAYGEPAIAAIRHRRQGRQSTWIGRFGDRPSPGQFAAEEPSKLQQQGAPIAYMDPPGGLAWMEDMLVLKGSPMGDCEQLLNFMLEPTVAIAWMLNRKASVKSVSPELFKP